MVRLPIPGQDNNTWGDILNNYLLVAHVADGSLRAGSVGTTSLQDNAITTPKLADNSVTTPKVANSSITESKLHPDVITQLQSVGITPSDQAKLDGIASGATANASDAQLRDRTTHTGTQPISSITNLQTELNAKASTADVTSGLATKADTADLATVATSGNYNDLTNRPTIPAAQVNADWNASTGAAQILNKPTIPDVSGFVTTAALTSGLGGKADVGHGHAITDVTNLTSELDGKMAVDATLTTTPTASQFHRNLAYTINTNDPDLSVVMINGVTKSWHNEWGAFRGTAPYNWGDALVRAIRSTGDGISDGTGSAGSGRAIELVDRRIASPPNITTPEHLTSTNVMWGVRWKDGRMIQGGNIVGAVYALDAGQTEADIPSSLPAGTLIVRKV